MPILGRQAIEDGSLEWISYPKYKFKTSADDWSKIIFNHKNVIAVIPINQFEPKKISLLKHAIKNDDGVQVCSTDGKIKVIVIAFTKMLYVGDTEIPISNPQTKKALLQALKECLKRYK